MTAAPAIDFFAEPTDDECTDDPVAAWAAQIESAIADADGEVTTPLPANLPDDITIVTLSDDDGDITHIGLRDATGKLRATIPFRGAVAVEYDDGEAHGFLGNGIQYVTYGHSHPYMAEPADVDDAPPLDATGEPMDWGNYRPTDPTPYLDGTATLPVPQLVAIPGGFLLYVASVQMFFGQPGSGKSWIALKAVADVLRSGGRAIYIDHENGAATTSARLRALGLPNELLRQPHLVHIVPNGPLDLTSMQAVARLGRADLAVIDSLGEHLAEAGVNPNSDDEVATALKNLRRILAYTLGAAVMLVDHVPKSTEADRLQPIGSQRKMAHVDAGHRVDAVTAPAKGTTGRLKLTCAKDRHGTWQRGTTVAEMLLTSNDNGDEVDARFEAPPVRADRMDTVCEAVSTAVENGPAEGLGVKALRTEVRNLIGSVANNDVDHAAARLVRDGHLQLVDQGHGRAKLHRHVRAYRAGGTWPQPDGTPTEQLVVI